MHFFLLRLVLLFGWMICTKQVWIYWLYTYEMFEFVIICLFWITETINIIIQWSSSQHLWHHQELFYGNFHEKLTDVLLSSIVDFLCRWRQAPNVWWLWSTKTLDGVDIPSASQTVVCIQPTIHQLIVSYLSIMQWNIKYYIIYIVVKQW